MYNCLFTYDIKSIKNRYVKYFCQFDQVRIDHRNRKKLFLITQFQRSYYFGLSYLEIGCQKLEAVIVIQRNRFFFALEEMLKQLSIFKKRLKQVNIHFESIGKIHSLRASQFWFFRPENIELKSST